MLKERSQTFKIIFIFIDFFIALLSFGIAFGYRYLVQDSEQFLLNYLDIKSYIFLCLLLSITQVLAFLGVDLYHPRRGLSFFEEFFSIFSGVALNLGVILSLLFFFREVSFSRLTIIYFFIINLLFTTLSHYSFRFTLMHLRRKGYNLRKMLIIGTGKNALRMGEVIQKHLIYGYHVGGYIAGTEILPELEKNTLGQLSDFEKIIQREKPDLVIYALDMDEKHYLKEVIDFCDHEGIEVKIVPGFTEFIAAHGRVEGMEGIPIITIRDIPVRNGYNSFLKRTFDLVFSSLFILCFSPFYLLISILVRLSSKGPIFIFQERVGLDNRSFRMIKFRTMYIQEKSESDTKWTIKDDPRVTPIGKILRKLSLDETPQFFNVLIGNMSVVGPRPERPFFVEQFKSNHHRYMRRHAVKAGITGWAQVQGLRGDTSIEERISADIYYIENWNLWLDIKIVLMTPFVGLINKNAY
jgi:Undecaprenyl-phosphate glucose phosphotransferase